MDTCYFVWNFKIKCLPGKALTADIIFHMITYTVSLMSD